ncbi:uncharacterized protein BXZ73DRAFT_43895, partial [Epithele typhae]|uniref:uncharacterized protein n=1 Tax=Epithele typhae TaxID=378194 RepID=UPI002008C1AF
EISDGEGALHAVEIEEAEKAETRGQQRGPKNRSIVHWSVARPTNDPHKGLRWTFTCRHCNAVRSFTRTIKGDDALWEDEPRKPSLANLASHLKQDHPAVLQGDAETNSYLAGNGTKTNLTAGGSKDGSFYNREDVKAFEGYMHGGPFDPNGSATQQGFTTVIAGWLLYEDLPFTTAEATSFKSLMHYCRIRFLLPSDKTVRTEAIDNWVEKEKAFRVLTLLPEEWDLIKELDELLSIFTTVTKEVSYKNRPTLPLVIPLYRQMKKELTDYMNNPNVSPALRAGARGGLEKLNKYFRLALESHYTVLACAFKGEDVAEKARTMLEHVFKEYAKTYEPPVASSAPPKSRSEQPSSFLHKALAFEEPDDENENLDTDKPPPEDNVLSELTRYLKNEGGKADDDDGVLRWWKVSQRGLF